MINRLALFSSLCFSLILLSTLSACGRAEQGSTTMEKNGSQLKPTASSTLLPLEAQVDNLVAFTRLYGFIRFFHPSDEALLVNWNNVAVNGVEKIRFASDEEELAARLETIFQPVAPGVYVFPKNDPPSVSEEPLPDHIPPSLEIVMWEHHGVKGDSQTSIYYSQRIEALAPNGTIPYGFFDPADPYYADLGAGVAAWIPLALFKDDVGTFPHSPVIEADTIDEAIPENTPGRRLAGIVVVWNLYQHFYPSWDVVKTDWLQALRVALSETIHADDEEEYYQILQRMVAQARDGHGNIFPPDNQNLYSPPLLLGWIENQMVVLNSSGIAQDNMRPGDKVLKVNGTPALKALADAERLVSASTPQWRRYKALTQILLTGPKDTQIVVEVQTQSGEKKEVTLERVYLGPPTRESRPAPIDEVAPNVWYVDLERINDQAFQEALPSLEKARGIVFDLRGYPGTSTVFIAHLIDHPVKSPQWLIPVFHSPDQKDVLFETSEWIIEPESPRLKAQIAFLVDERAISYAETCLGIIEHYRLGKIVGEPTAGTNGNANQIEIPGGYRLIWTGMKVLKQDGSQHHGIGIHPTINVSQTLMGIVEGQDDQLERAVAEVK